MYISTLKLWNFRKYGSLDPFDISKPSLLVNLNKGLNILIGENDSGKTAIIDAIKLVLKTHAYEWIKVEESDFFTQGRNTAETLRIEIEFSGISNHEAANFTEWCGWSDEIDDDGKKVKRPKLFLYYQATFKDGKIFPSDVRAGMDGHGNLLTAEAKEYLKCTYLKALRDADSELAARKNSRLSQILREHQEFKTKQPNGLHEFEELFDKTSQTIQDKFAQDGVPYNTNIKKVVDDFISAFIGSGSESSFDLGATRINSILEKISLGIIDASNLGLGTMNRLFMAAELLHLKKVNWNGLKLCMIEELEAHLHPQAQLKIINRLKQEKDLQYILTTHSPNITSQADLADVIICKNVNVYSLGQGYTKLDEPNYKYLRRFLDVTKSSLFFSKGNIIVEGWSEEILLPVLAKKLGYDLTKQEISIVNVASTAYLHFAKIFLRSDGTKMNVPVSIITDLDNRPNEDGVFKALKDESKEVQKKQRNIEKLKSDLAGTDVTLEIAKEWTLEWCLFKSCLSELFKDALSTVHSKTDEFKKEKGHYKAAFQGKFIKKLSKQDGTSPIDKVALANELAEILDNDTTITQEQIIADSYLQYIVNAIKHVC
ncbi:ATP-dependent endonuclease [Elizabethkingia anophelis]|nr:ATP-dependent endonuclease [Elizabethkingia anophelis]